MNKAILLGISISLIFGTMIGNANDIFLDSVDNEEYSIDIEVPGIQNQVIKEEQNDHEYEIAKAFSKRYAIINTQDNNKHDFITAEEFAHITSQFINLTHGEKTQIIESLPSTRKNFIVLIGDTILPSCSTDSCILESTKLLNIHSLDQDQLSRGITYYEAYLLLWRTYIHHKAISFEQNALQESQININKLIKSSKFNDFEVIQYINDRNNFFSNSYKKEYGPIECYYNQDKNIAHVACTYNFKNNPFYSMEVDGSKSSIHELAKLSSKSNELYLGQLSYY